MTDQNILRKEMLDEIVNRKNLGDKKFHSETSLQQFGENEIDNESRSDENDPGVQNSSVKTMPASPEEDVPARRRTMSQPGPGSGSTLTATAGRRRRPPRSVMYADLESVDTPDRSPNLTMPNRDDYPIPPTPLNTAAENASPFFYNGIYRNGDIKSNNNYRLQTPVDLRGGSTPRKRSVVTMDAQSIRSVDTQAPPPTNPKDNQRLTIKYFTMMLSCMYAVLLVTLGLIIHVADPFLNFAPSMIYSLVLLAVGFLYLVYLITDINRYKAIALKNQKIKGIHNDKVAEFFRKQEEEYNNNGTGDRTPQSTISQAFPSAVLIPLRHDYCFSYGRHSGSFYLKLGAAGFALGHLVHSVLLITVEISYIFDEKIDNETCVDVVQVVLDVCNPLYCFLQLYFIFKYSNVLILRAQGLAHFGFMHMIGSSLCFWISTIVREIMLALTIYANSVYGNRNETQTYSEIHQRSFLDVSGLYNEKCKGPATITSIVENLSPYLYPFGVEFNILIGDFILYGIKYGSCAFPEQITLPPARVVFK